MPPDADTFDYVIVGAGAAGSVLANRLTADRAATVCVLEAGPPDRNPCIHIPAGFIKTLVDPGVTWQFKTEPLAMTGGRRIATDAGPHPGRLLLGQRDDLQPRPAGRPRPLGAARQPRLGLRRTACPTTAAAKPHRLRRGQPGPLRGRHPGHRHGLDQPDLGGLHRRLRRHRDPPQPRLQQRRPGRRRLFPARHPERPPGFGATRLPQAGPVPPQSGGPHQCAGQRHPVRGQARHRHPLRHRARRARRSR